VRTSIVQVLGRKRIDDAIKTNSQWKASLNRWFRIASGAGWKTFAEVRQTLRNADYVKGKVVFNIANNKARLISQIDYEMGTVIVEQVLSHADYDNWKP